MTAIPLVDVFAGPGGLNEGFSSLRDESGRPVFETVASFEMDETACKTLTLRAALRQAERELGEFPDAYYEFMRDEIPYSVLEGDELFKPFLKEATEEVYQLRLGEETREESDGIMRKRLAQVLESGDPWVLVGGPPCQAYSLAGRSRRTGDPSFSDDHKHVLYREYLNIIEQFEPAIFVMENVKGMLSSRHQGSGIFARIKEDLEQPKQGLKYVIKSFKVPDTGELQPSDYILRAEDYGIPQRRHRVILLGVREDLHLPEPQVLAAQPQTTVADAIAGLPSIRSMVSPRSQDSVEAWRAVTKFVSELAGSKKRVVAPGLGARFVASDMAAPASLGSWLKDPRVGGAALHESRAHMVSDLARYGYLAHESAEGRAPKLGDLPSELRPNHRNADRDDAPFTDRFRVQHWDSPSTTIVSHICKDGHYYIHPDSTQMRSLTVREAARLQTFPDNYMFMGNRTQQYHQVGNAVPPLLAKKLGGAVARMLGIAVTNEA